MNSGVIMLFYDLPTKTKTERSKYQKFCKYIKSIGFSIIQNSVYLRYLDNIASHPSIVKDIKKNTNVLDGTIYALIITSKQYNSIVEIKGNCPKIDNENVLVI